MKSKKIALVFPGQGSQYVGMGKDLYDEYKLVRDIYDKASSVLGYKIAEKCFKPHKLGKIIHGLDLDRTIFTQPAVLTTSYACFKVIEEECRKAEIDFDFSLSAGHSLGEYTALLVSGAFDFETCVNLVNKRATYITEFSKAYPDAGLMAIVDKKGRLDYETMQNLCENYQVYITIFNTKSQIVVGGFKKNLGELHKKLKKDGKIGTMLKVEGPFHSPLMKPAAEKFKKQLRNSTIHIASKPVIANVTSEAIVDPDHIRKELYEQIFTFVDWKRAVEKMIDNGADLFIEVGPKTVLSNMVKGIQPTIQRLNVENLESLRITLKELAG
jgi:[acyl-carrier-protein] S-malonyltransferase